MELKHTEEIFQDFMGRYNFSTVFAEKNFPLKIESTYSRMSNHESIDFLLNSALTGNKVIGFFNRLPLFKPERLIRGECVFVTTRLPEKIIVPTLFCRVLNELPVMLPYAQKVSFETNLPVVVVISDNVLNNFTDAPMSEFDYDRISPYIHPNTFKKSLDELTFHERLTQAGELLNRDLPNPAFTGNALSFLDPEAEFFRFIVPCVKCDLSTDFKKLETIRCVDAEESFMTYLVQELFMMTAKIETYSRKKPYETRAFLCPGCPFVAIFSKMKLQDKIVFTDVQCEGVLEAFPLFHMELPAYLGIISKKTNVETIFIGNSSNYNRKYDELLNNGTVILLGDIDRQKVPGFTTIKHPKKIGSVKNILFPYSCSNIKTYRGMRIKPKKCTCVQSGVTPSCIEKTMCPALIPEAGQIKIDQDLCTGCTICVLACKNGAIR